MISASTFSRQNSIWDSVAPTLDDVTKWANDNGASLGKSVRSFSLSGRHSLLSEVAFLDAKNTYTRSGLSAREIERRAREFVTKLPRSEMAHGLMTDEEWVETRKLADRTVAYVASKSNVQFSPPIPGCGVVDAAVADIRCDGELIEVKSVSRPFRSMDYRQILTYVTMLYAARIETNVVTLLNPRRSRFVSIDLEELSATACGKSKVEMMQDIAMWMTGLQVSA